MNRFCIHPLVYATQEEAGLLKLLEKAWVRDMTLGSGTITIVSGFGAFNGGVRFYKHFAEHIKKGGKVAAIFAGSTSSRLTSKEVVRELLGCGADVTIINRKRLVHAKLYGWHENAGQSLVVTSGNFTGPGMSQNVEASVLLDSPTLAAMKFEWCSLTKSLLNQKWLYYKPSLKDPAGPAWKLLYDEKDIEEEVDETGLMTMVIVLSHADTARVQASPNSIEGKGSQYFWLSRDSFDFFPPLTIRNVRGEKTTYSCIVSLKYCDLGVVDDNCRVTFEAENNLDFRLGTGRLRYTKLADEGDIATITRVSEHHYELRLFAKGTKVHKRLEPHATTFIGHRGKRYGFMPNSDFEVASGTTLT